MTSPIQKLSTYKNQQTDDSSELCPTIIFTFTNPIILRGIELLIFYDSILSLYFLYET
jgi:hypothetical protein